MEGITYSGLFNNPQHIDRYARRGEILAGDADLTVYLTKRGREGVELIFHCLAIKAKNLHLATRLILTRMTRFQYPNIRGLYDTNLR